MRGFLENETGGRIFPAMAQIRGDCLSRRKPRSVFSLLTIVDANSPPKGTKCPRWAFGTLESHKRQGKTVSTPYDPQSAPDVVYLRNTGFALLALTVLAGAISVFGVLKISQPLVMAQSAESAVPAALAESVMPPDDFLLRQIERNILQREMLEAHYVNPKSI